jgi:hypothetical protein
MTTYDKFPTVMIQGYDDSAWQGWEAITRILDAKPNSTAAPSW